MLQWYKFGSAKSKSTIAQRVSRVDRRTIVYSSYFCTGPPQWNAFWYIGANEPVNEGNKKRAKVSTGVGEKNKRLPGGKNRSQFEVNRG